MIYGTIKWFDLNRGIGVITTSEGTDVFMPYSAVLSNGLRYPEAGQMVALEVEPTTHNYNECDERLTGSNCRGG